MRITSALILVLTLLNANACAKPQGVAPGRAQTQTANAVESYLKVQQAEAKTPDLSAYFKRFPGTFVLYDLKNGRYLRHDAARAAKRFSPYSTFKIPNSLIGLETGVITDAEFRIKWDAKKYPRNRADTEPFIHWWQEQTLRTAFRRSVLWYYQELATGVGAERMKALVDKLNYGNRDTSGPLTRFWLNNSLRISADEQVEFLKALYKEQLPVSKRTLQIVKDILTLEETPDYKLSAKTGGGPLGEDKALGWFVGYLETKGNVYFFATQIEGPDFLAVRDERIRLTKEILRDLGHLPNGQ